MSEITLQDALKKQDLRYYKKSIDANIIEKFSERLNIYAENVNYAFNNIELGANEEYYKKLVNSFLETNFYNDDKYSINTKGNIDSAITKNGQLLCIIETKTPRNTSEMLDKDNINKKALHELIYYYLEETRDVTGNKIRRKLNSQIRNLVATNSAKFFIFDSDSIENIIKDELENYYFNFKNNNYNVSKTSAIYEYINNYLYNNPDVLSKIDYVYFDMKDVRNYKSKKTLTSLYKILSKYYLLKEKYTFQVSSHTLNKKFYNNELIILTEDKEEKNILKAYITAAGNHARDHFNQRQIDVIKDEILPEMEKITNSNQIGIISPYKNQKEKLEKIMETDYEIDTVHKYQGREKDAIILTTVDNKITDFVDNPKLLNVAISRAKKYLRVVVSDNVKNEETNISDLVKYIQYNNFEIVQSNVKSIYDILYKENRSKRIEYFKNKKRQFEYESEEVTYDLIKNIIEKNDYNNLDIVSHILLSHILYDMEKLTEIEKKYANNTWTHIDFVIFNKMNKSLVLAIEVDGYYYHKEGTKQEERDRLKEKILEKYGVPLIRLNTTGSGEEKILENKIKEILNVKSAKMEEIC